ncbi:hypothetical protein F5X68DRAFT_265046 [Plectosphaerella plurivora]|uniref:Uncharacterized protein n=1 Tax=Plectosphaerella plurivora TaxID=936078 RepID=A0A9P8V3J7_9PEZI|nr:hypothetical protein F5X68DRAFT_265046 [Plectosphaerella plurivora]
MASYNGTAAVGFPIDDEIRCYWEILFGIFGGAFAATFVGIMSVGFGTVGITAGSLAAAIQSAMYGAFVPAGGWFATLTGIGMTGNMGWVAGAAASSNAAFATWVVAKLGLCKS